MKAVGWPCQRRTCTDGTHAGVDHLNVLAGYHFIVDQLLFDFRFFFPVCLCLDLCPEISQNLIADVDILTPWSMTM